MGLTATIPLLLALTPCTWLLVVANFVAGVGGEQAGVAWYSTLNEQIPEDRLARVYAYDDLGSYLALPLAQFAAGPAVLLLGLQTTLYAAAALILLATLAMVSTPSIRALVPKDAQSQRLRGSSASLNSTPTRELPPVGGVSGTMVPPGGADSSRSSARCAVRCVVRRTDRRVRPRGCRRQGSC
ncbi:MFS transporter [Streptomyces pseudovenezuelae]|uniref:hypothetical protein n=1 Tax=Streptomyces pseudovenezuelae TaxID=67350 RepID=UPI0036EF963B